MRFRSVLAALASTTLLASGCGAFEDSGDAETTVAAAFYPLAYVAERIADGTPTDVQALTQPGGEAHDLELGVRATAVVSEADLVLFAHGFQPAVDQAVEQNAEGATLDAADVVDLLSTEESPDEHAEHAEEEGHDHEHGDEDPHFWHDPLRMATLGEAVGEELAGIDPDNAATYEENAAGLRTELEALDEEFSAGLADCERDTVVVSHDAFGYLEKYGVHLAAIAGISPGAEPSPAHRAALQDLIRDEGITTVFTERLAVQELGRTLADEMGIATAVLDPIEGLAEETSDEDYLSLMQQNLDALRRANGCP